MSSSSAKSGKPELISPTHTAADNNNQLPANQEQNADKFSRKACSTASNCRKTRQLRMFKVIIVIMLTFFVCRLPTWIFLLIKLNTNLSSSASWIVHFSLGLLSLANCAINPFLYTFLTETIRFGSDVRDRFRKLCSWRGNMRGENLIHPNENNCESSTSAHKSFWRKCCCWWQRCGVDVLPTEGNLIDHCESDRGLSRKSYTLNGKEQLSSISSKVNAPFGSYANVYQSYDPVLPSVENRIVDHNHFEDVDLNK